MVTLLRPCQHDVLRGWFLWIMTTLLLTFNLRFDKVHELLWDRLIIFLQVLLQVIQDGLIFLEVDEGRRHSFVPSTSRPSNPMHVVNKTVGCTVVNNVGDAINIDTSGRHVSTDQHISSPIRDGIKTLFSLLLRLASMNGCGPQTTLVRQELSKVLHVCLQINKDDSRQFLCKLLEQLTQFSPSLRLSCHKLNSLFNVFLCTACLTNLYMNREF